MAQTISVFPDGSRLEFDQGGFDSWCVYFTSRKGNRVAPRDLAYFSSFQKLGKKYGAEKIYHDFVRIYDSTSETLDQPVIELIKSLAAGYQRDRLKVEQLFTIIYAAMIAEENKAGKVVGKRLKRLAMHQVLIEQLAPEYAATFSIGKKVPELRQEFAKRGFK